MKKMTMGIVAMMMAFGTMTMNAATASKNDNRNNRNNNGYVVNNQRDKDKGDRDYKDFGRDNDRYDNRFARNIRMANSRYSRYCLTRNKYVGRHKHYYVRERVNGYYTGHMVCVRCNAHMR